MVSVVLAVGDPAVRVTDVVPRLQPKPVDVTQASVTFSWCTDSSGPDSGGWLDASESPAWKRLSGPPERETETAMFAGRLVWLTLVGAAAIRKLP